MKESAFEKNILEVYKDEGASWLKALPEIVKDLEEEMNFNFLSPVQDLTYGYVAHVEHNHKKAILKITPSSGPTKTEHIWLRSFSNDIVPEIYGFNEKHNALLMEALIPGHTLKELVKKGDDDKATMIICESIRKLQAKPQASSSYTHLSKLQDALSILRGHFDQKLLEKAETLFKELTTDRSNDVLLHGDLHHDNILSSGENWKVIDPHGYIGDPAFEIGPMMYNPLDAFPKDVDLFKTSERRFHILKSELSFDPERMKAWAFCMAVLSIAWTFEGSRTIPEHERELANILDRL